MAESNELWTTLFLAGAGVYALLAVAVLRSRLGPGSRTIGVTLLVIAAWVASAALELAVEGLEAFVWVLKVKYSLIAFTPPLCFLFFLLYTQRSPKRLGPLAAALVAIPLLTVAAVWTNELHEWMWAHPPVDADGATAARLDWGSWFYWVHMPYSYLLLGIGVVVLFSELWSASALHRSQTALLLVAVTIPLATNVLFVAGYGPSRLSLTPVAFSVSGILFAWGFFRLQLFRLSPIAYRTAFEHLRDGVVVADRFGRVAELNPAALELLPAGASALVGDRVEKLLPPIRNAGLADDAASYAEAIEWEVRPGCCLELRVSPIEGRSGARLGWVVLLRDVTRQRRAERSLRESEALVRGIVDRSPNGILRLRPVWGVEGELRDFACLFANPSASARIGCSAEQLMGRPFKEAVHPHTAALFHAFREVLLSGEPCDLELAMPVDGDERWTRCIAVRVGSDLLVTLVDISDQKRHQHEMEAVAYTDMLTGVLNRRGLEEDAEAVIRHVDGRGRPCALLYVDLDGFKEINDGLGHHAGDRVLREVARRMQACTRGPDLLARIGGDEFVMLLAEADAEQARHVALRLLASCTEPIEIERGSVQCDLSVGIALGPEHGRDLKMLLDAADRAMYRAKEESRDRQAGHSAIVFAR